MLEIEVGQVVGGKYELVRLLGRGSMGQVWVAHHRTLGENVALKLLDCAALGDQGEQQATSAARFQFEARVAARLSRKTRHIVRVTDHGEEESGLTYLVMELLEGETLERVLALRGPMHPADVVRIVTQIARALEEAHAESIVHRDLKPANIFVTRDEDGRLLIKLLDFGIARAIHTHRVTPIFATGNGLIFGTAGYMSPEQACGSKIDARCDLWALATIAYETLTGELPLVGSTIEELLRSLCTGQLVPVHARRPYLPSSLGPFFERAFARRLEQRFVSASQLAHAFEQAMGRDFTNTPGPVVSLAGARDGHTLRAVHAARPPGQRKGGWTRVALVGPVAMLISLAVGVAARFTPASAPPGVGLTSSMEQPAMPNETAALPASVPGFDGPLPDGPRGTDGVSERREPSLTGNPSSSAVAAPSASQQPPRPRLLPGSAPLPTVHPPQKALDRSAVL